MNAFLNKFITFHSLIRGIIFLTCFFGTMTAVFHSGFFVPHDFTHAARIAEMNRSLLSGEFPVRWSQNFGFGYGMPLFNFYAPLPYYVAQIPYMLGLGAVNSIKFLYILSALFAFFSMYLFSSVWWGKKGGLVSAIVFSFSTYRALDLYVRGDIGEVWAMSLLPFVLFGITQLIRGKKWGGLITCVSLAAVLLSHNLTGLICLPFVGVFAIVVALIEHRIFLVAFKRLVTSLLILIFGIGLSGFYIIPGFFEKQFTRVAQTITVGYFDFHNHVLIVRQLLFGKWGYGASYPYPYSGLSFVIGIGTLFLVGLAVIGLLKATSKQRLFFVLCACLCGLTTFMSLNKSIWIWEHIDVLKYMQFPWRFLLFSHVFIALLAGGSVFVRKIHPFLFLFVLLGLGIMLVQQSKDFTPEKFVTDSQAQQVYYTDPISIQAQMSKTLNDYLPPSIVGNELLPLQENRLVIEKGKGEISFVKNVPSDIVAAAACEDTCVLQVNLFQFPGWRAIIDGKSQHLSQNSSFPIYSLTVSKGNHLIEVRLQNTPIREVSNIISLGSVSCLVLYCFWMRKRKV
ncbi:hypothetical protein C5B42_00825 [Candidatus Cerribacteria bacterium 'Amazon FNV 2010 28 9']|uniref:Membrane protein 6-pyruvoyl-tetrahydropterin synthase-related domain-containing protein n=1 Tax=Candidatus Cerribacteria bacterium 'Amazon FNV 2010 28 9' TaxID=2081795 RepID=A0A317JRB3_9BACT|nr:MAG: hypothetical protein C5B42_00825 [Candidatus Cerribacteria bacterium 'Amazon FNV 2010 28 9']